MICFLCGLDIEKLNQNGICEKCAETKPDSGQKIDWSKLKCHWHPDRQAMIWVNPFKGALACKECMQEWERNRIKYGCKGFIP